MRRASAPKKEEQKIVANNTGIRRARSEEQIAADAETKKIREEETAKRIQADKERRTEAKALQIAGQGLYDTEIGTAEQAQKAREEAVSSVLSFNPYKLTRMASPGTERKAATIAAEKMVSDEIGTYEHAKEQAPIEYDRFVEQGKRNAKAAGRDIIYPTDKHDTPVSGEQLIGGASPRLIRSDKPLTGEQEEKHGGGSGGFTTSNHELTEYMTQEEIDYYYYLVAKNGIEEADKWLKGAYSELNRRKWKPYTEDISNSSWNIARAVPNALGFDIFGKLRGFADDLVEMVTTGKYDPYSAGNEMANYAQAINQEVLDLIPDGIGKFAYNTAISIAESSIAGALGSAAGGTIGSAAGSATSPLAANAQQIAENWAKGITLGIMSAQAAESEFNEAYNRGLSYNQSFALGILAGAIEAFTEQFSVDALFDEGATGFRYFLKNLVAESSEEGASNVLNYIADWVIAGKESELEQSFKKYSDAGYNNFQAFLKAVQDHAPSFTTDVLGGLISGAAMAGPQAVSSATSNVVSKINKQILKARGVDVDALVDLYKQAKAAESAEVLTPKESETPQLPETPEAPQTKYLLTETKNGQVTFFVNEYDTLDEAMAAGKQMEENGQTYIIVDSQTGKEVNIDGAAESAETEMPANATEQTKGLPTFEGETETAKAVEESVPEETTNGQEEPSSFEPSYATDSDTEQIMAEMAEPVADETGVSEFKGAKDTHPEEDWVAQNSNEDYNELTAIEEALKSGKEIDLEKRAKKAQKKKTVRLNTLLAEIKKGFDVSISKGKVRKKNVLGFYNPANDAIRIKEANNVPTALHEIGHYIDNKYGISDSSEGENGSYVGNQDIVDGLVSAIERLRPEWAKGYKPEQLPGEAIAEFIRYYATDKAYALSASGFGEAGEELLNLLDEQDRAFIDNIADKFNAYARSSIMDRMYAAFGTEQELQKELDALETFGDKLRRGSRSFMRVIDKNNDLKSVSKVGADVYHRAMYTVHSNKIALGIIEGDNMTDIDGDIAPMRDVDGKVIEEEPGKAKKEVSLKGVLEQIHKEGDSLEQRRKNEKDFNALVIAERALALYEYEKSRKLRRRVSPDPYIDNPQAMKAVRNEILLEHPEWQSVLDEYNRWQRSLLYTWGVRTGVISKALFKKLGEVKFYSPLQRFIGVLPGEKTKGAESKNIVMRMKGSGEPIITPVYSTAANVQKMVTIAMRNAVKQAAAQFATLEHSAVFLEEVPPDMQKQIVSKGAVIDEIVSKLSSLGGNETDAASLSELLDKLLDEGGVGEWTVAKFQGKDIMTVMVDGKPKYYEIHSQPLYNALMTMTEGQMATLVKAVSYVSNAFKSLTTGHNPIWALKNKIMDIQTAYYSSIERNWLRFMVQEAKYTFDAFKGAFGKSDEYMLYQERGGGSSPYLGHKTKALSSVMEGVLRTEKGGFVGFARNVIEALGKMSDVVEQSTRYAEYQRVLQSGGSARSAILAADEVTVNFNRGSSSLKTLDAFMPYTKSAINGLYHDINLFTDKKTRGRNILRLAAGNAAGVALEMIIGCIAAGGWDEWEKEYDKLSFARRNNYYCLYVGNGKFIYIPKAHLLSAPSTLIEQATTQVFGAENNVNRKDEMEEFGWYLLQQINPFGSVVGVSTAFELAKNESYTGSKIVSESKKSGPEEEQYDERTSWLAYTLGNFLGWSPMKIDYVLQQNFGIVGDLATSIKKFGGTGEAISSLFRGGWYGDNAYSTDRINRLYAEKNDAEIKNKSDNATASDKYVFKIYDAVTSVVGGMLAASKGEENAREIRSKAGDVADEFRQYMYNAEIRLADEIAESTEKTERSRDDAVIALANRTSTDIGKVVPYVALNRQFSVGSGKDKKEYTVDGLTLGSMWLDYVSAIDEAYDGILEADIDDDTKVKSLIKAKDVVKEAVLAKYALVSEGVIDESTPIATNELGMSTAEYAYYTALKSVANSFVSTRDDSGKEIESKEDKIKEYIAGLDIDQEMKYMLYESLYPRKKTSADIMNYPWFDEKDTSEPWWDEFWSRRESEW